MMDKARSLRTFYGGCWFRSRLEAKWAAAFDAMGIAWQYELQGYKLSNGQFYLPDFLLTNVRTRSTSDGKLFVEVKGPLDDPSISKVGQFHEDTGYPIVLIGGFNLGENPDAPWAKPWPVQNPEPFWSFEFVDGDQYPYCAFCLDKGEVWFCGADHDQWDGGTLLRKGVYAACAQVF